MTLMITQSRISTTTGAQDATRPRRARVAGRLTDGADCAEGTEVSNEVSKPSPLQASAGTSR
jgi:hypothetical protein